MCGGARTRGKVDLSLMKVRGDLNASRRKVPDHQVT